MHKKVLVIIPAYNEEESIGEFMNKLFNAKIDEWADVLIIDDGSVDDTVKNAKEFKVKVISQIYNLGYGAALQLGYKYAEKEGYEYVIQLDADGQHDVCNIERIYEALTSKTGANPDIVIGSRFLKESVSFKVSGMKKIVIIFFRWIIKTIGKIEVTDPTSGLQGLNKKAFSYYGEYGNFDYKYPDINMIMQMVLLGFSIKEIPAVMHERTSGSSMHNGIIKPIIYMVLMMMSTLNTIIRSKKAKN